MPRPLDRKTNVFAKLLQVFCWLLPASTLKNNVLRRFGHQISDTAVIGPTLVFGVRKFEIGDHARLNPFNAFKSLSLARLDDSAWIASWNWISAAPEFQAVDPNAGTLHMQRSSKIGSRNYLDCSGTIVIREYAWVGGNKTFLQSHEPDLVNYRQTAGRIVIGRHSLVHSCAVLLKGAVLPDQSVLETNSTLLPSKEPLRRGVYSGSPAKWVGEATGSWFERSDTVTSDHEVEGPLGPERNSLTAPNYPAQNGIQA